jgi:sulfate transport system permease protein
MSTPKAGRLLLRVLALGYLAVILLVPVGAVIWRAFGDGIAPVWQAITTPDALHAFWLSLLIAAIVVPLNTVFGIACAVVLVRQRFWGRRLLDAVIDLPFAISPVVIGLALILVYGQAGWLGGWLAERGIQVIFSLPGMVLATVFVSLPYVVREVAPVLREVGTDQEEAAWTLGASPLRAFLQVTLPAIRWGVAYKGPWRVRRGHDRVRPPGRPDRDPHPVRGEPLRGLRPHRRLRRRAGVGHPGPARPAGNDPAPTQGRPLDVHSRSQRDPPLRGLHRP